MRIIVGAVGGLLAVILIFALIDAFIISPNRAVAEIDDTSISLTEWQERVRFERAQYINLLESQLEAFGDVGTVQQFGGQYINELMEGEALGQSVLNTMVQDAIIAEEAANRGIEVTDEEIERRN